MRRTYGGELMQENHRGVCWHRNGNWEAFWQAKSIQKTPKRHPRGIQETPRPEGGQRHLRGKQEAARGPEESLRQSVLRPIFVIINSDAGDHFA